MTFLAPAAGRIYVDCTLGLGGHTEEILKRSSPNGKVIGFEWDQQALAFAAKRLARFSDRVSFVHRNFATLQDSLAELGIDKVDGLLLDVGLSSLQIDKSGRGFSFKGSESLDMRMDLRRLETAADILNEAGQDALADIFYYYGEERQARRIAAAVVAERKKKRIESTDHLVAVIEKAVPKRFHPKKIHVATKVFQGLRIAVNKELENLEKVLGTGADVLKTGGRFCAIAFHSLEDRMFKRAFQKDTRLRVITKRPVTPGEAERRTNRRARSAKLRVAEREGEKR